DEVVDDGAGKLLGEVEDVEGNVEHLRHPPGVLGRVQRAATALVVARRSGPQLQHDPGHVPACVLHEGGGNRRIHAARHANDCLPAHRRTAAAEADAPLGEREGAMERRRSTTAGRTSSTASTSSSVVARPSDSRREPWASSGRTPIAISTWDGSNEPEVQADPLEAASPLASSISRSDSPSTPSMQTFTVPATLAAPAPLTFTSPMVSTMPAGSRSRS